MEKQILLRSGTHGVKNPYRRGFAHEPTPVSLRGIVCAADGKKDSLSANGKKYALTANPARDSVPGLAKSLLRDVVAGLSRSSASRPRSAAATAAAVSPLPEDLRSPTYAIAALNTVLFLACALLPASAGMLNHRQPQVWQLLTSCFAHPSLEGLLQCVFFTYVFGRVVERAHGAAATWAVYLACGTVAAGLAWFLLPAKAGLLSSAAPAAAWGLFLVAVGLPRLAKKPLEVACLAPFAFAATVNRYSPLSSSLLSEGTAVGQLVHVAGASMAAAGAALVLRVVERVQEERERRRLEAKRQEPKAEAASQEEAVSQIVNIASQAAAQFKKKLG